MFRTLAVLCLAVLPAAATAAEPMGGSAFDAYTQGRTLWFEQGGTVYGVERYLPGRRVQWSFLDGECRDGEWYEDAGRICFVYEDDGTGGGIDPQCWTFSRDANGLRAEFAGDPPGPELYEARERDEPMVCLGPRVGA